VRLQFARTPRSRNILHRLGIFVLACAAVTVIGNWIDLNSYVSASAWFDIGWAIPYLAAGLVALTWTPGPEPQSTAQPTNFLSFLGSNLVLVAVLFCMNLMLEDWKRAHGAMLTDTAVVALLLAFSFRLAITQHAQQQEIVQRKAAQEQLSAANETIGSLLEESRIETGAVTQISEIGALLQGCASRDEAFCLIPERMARLFPGTSGTLSVLNSIRTRAEVVARWGNVRSEGTSLSIPLVAHEEAIGVLMIQDDFLPLGMTETPYANDAARRRQLASSVAEHIALTISNLDLRQALHLQATRDPLTSLYNRRYMQEALDREFHRARRRGRPLSVMLLDIDHFKRYNDSFGHAAGDDALRLVGETLLGSVRAEDLACRYGGEEFLLILPECPLEQAGVRADQIRTRLKELYLEREGELPDVVAVSIGVAAFEETTTSSVEVLIKFADDALYQAKQRGRDQVVIARQEEPPASTEDRSQAVSRDPNPTGHPEDLASAKSAT
jgi:diguanylate cyclase (GGDEF)-like protein